MSEQSYMNPATGSVDVRDGWFYQDESGREVNAVDLGEVVPVVLIRDAGDTLAWTEGRID